MSCASATSQSQTWTARFWYAWTARPSPSQPASVGITREALEEFERELEPVGLLRVERDRDAGRDGTGGEGLEPRQELAEHAPFLRDLVARVQRRELDRNARPILDPRRGAAGPAHRFDRVLVGAEVAVGVGRGAGGLAEHVVGEAVAERCAGRGAVDRVLDRLADDELLGHDLHRLADRAAHERLARARDEPPHDRRRVVAWIVGPRGERAGKHQPPGRRVEEEPALPPCLRLPLGTGELVADELILRLRVGYAEQRLGKAHEDYALARRQPEPPQERLGAGGLAGAPPDLARERERAVGDAAARRLVEPDARRQRCDGLRLVDPVRAPDCLPASRVHRFSAPVSPSSRARP